MTVRMCSVCLEHSALIVLTEHGRDEVITLLASSFVVLLVIFCCSRVLPTFNADNVRTLPFFENFPYANW